MSIADALLPEFDREMAVTRKLLERVPEDKFAWKPHEKSMSLVELSTHVATLPFWGTPTLTQSELDLGTQPQNTAATSRAGPPSVCNVACQPSGSRHAETRAVRVRIVAPRSAASRAVVTVNRASSTRQSA